MADPDSRETCQRVLADRQIEHVIAVPDPTGAIAWQYGVVCWPTTVWINEEGRIGGIQFGRGSPSMHEPSWLSCVRVDVGATRP